MEHKSYSTIITFLILILAGIVYLIFNNTQSAEITADQMGAQVRSAIVSNSDLKGTKPPYALQRGVSSPEVKELQEFLATQGFYRGPVNGEFGRVTESAVRSFQTKYGIQPTGVVGGGNAAQTAVCTADGNSDGVINTADFTGLLAEFGSQGEDLSYDLDGDGIVGAQDLSILLTLFGQLSDCVYLYVSIDSDTLQSQNISYNDFVGQPLPLVTFNLETSDADQYDMEISSIMAQFNIEKFILDDNEDDSPSDDIPLEDVIGNIRVTNNLGMVLANSGSDLFGLADEDGSSMSFTIPFVQPIQLSEGDGQELTISVFLKQPPMYLPGTSGASISGVEMSIHIDPIMVNAIDAVVEIDNNSYPLQNISGFVWGNPVSVFKEGLKFEFSESQAFKIEQEGDLNDTAQFVIEFEVEAFGEGMLIPKEAWLADYMSSQLLQDSIDEIWYTMDTPEGVLYGPGPLESEHGLSYEIVTTAEDVGDFYHIEEGADENFTITITKQMNDNSDAGFYKLNLHAIPWVGDDWFSFNGMTTQEDVEYYFMYHYLDDFEVGPLYLN